MRPTVLALALVACNGSRRETPPAPAPAPAEAAPVACERLPFASKVDVAEASGAVVLDEGVLVVGDSGTNGAYVIVDRETGEERERGALPLGDGAGDDLEGLARDGDRIVALTSAGWMRAWRRVPGGFELVDGPYVIGPGPMSCDAHKVNCGKNYEGLCVGGDDPVCAGWAASKDDGHLHCLVRGGERLRAHGSRRIAITHDDALSGCAFDAATGALWAITNAFDGNLYRIDGDEARRVEAPAGLFPEAVAADDGVVWRFSDLSRPPSPAERLRCR